MGKRGRKAAPWFAAVMTAATLVIGGPVGAVAVASAAYTGYRLGKKNASAKEVAGTLAVSCLTFGIGKVATEAQPLWLEITKKK